MIHIAILATVLASAPAESSAASTSAVQQCFATMDGAVYHGDPSDRVQMKRNVAACEQGIRVIASMRPGTAQGPEKLFLTARILDRAATLTYMGLSDAKTALREVRLANLYFRVASGLTNQPQNYRSAALANVELTNIQLSTLQSEVTAATPTRSLTLASRAATVKHRSRVADSQPAEALYAAYH